MTFRGTNGRNGSSSRCQLGGRLFRCTNPGMYVCQYCARSFCEEHATYVEGHEEVCARRECRAKWDDLQLHFRYREFVFARNRAGVCGVEGCEGRFGYVCSLCQGQFCPDHLSERLYPVFDGYRRREEPRSVCDHCWERRKIWSQR